MLPPSFAWPPPPRSTGGARVAAFHPPGPWALCPGPNITYELGYVFYNAFLSDLSPEKRIGAISGYDLVISGHTDELPIHNENFRSNWHLSAARAVAVADALIARGVAPERITTQGFAEFRPLFANTDAVSRQKNRRVEITLVKKAVN